MVPLSRPVFPFTLLACIFLPPACSSLAHTVPLTSSHSFYVFLFQPVCLSSAHPIIFFLTVATPPPPPSISLFLSLFLSVYMCLSSEELSLPFLPLSLSLSSEARSIPSSIRSSNSRFPLRTYEHYNASKRFQKRPNF